MSLPNHNAYINKTPPAVICKSADFRGTSFGKRSFMRSAASVRLTNGVDDSSVFEASRASGMRPGAFRGASIYRADRGFLW